MNDSLVLTELRVKLKETIRDIGDDVPAYKMQEIIESIRDILNEEILGQKERG